MVPNVIFCPLWFKLNHLIHVGIRSTWLLLLLSWPLETRATTAALQQCNKEKENNYNTLPWIAAGANGSTKMTWHFFLSLLFIFTFIYDILKFLREPGDPNTSIFLEHILSWPGYIFFLYHKSIGQNIPLKAWTKCCGQKFAIRFKNVVSPSNLISRYFIRQHDENFAQWFWTFYLHLSWKPTTIHFLTNYLFGPYTYKLAQRERLSN